MGIELQELDGDQIAERVEATLRRAGGESGDLLELAEELARRRLFDLEMSVRSKEARNRAWAALRQPGGDPDELFKLAKEIKGRNLFGTARRLLDRACKLSPEPSLRMVQQLALCTYKDQDVPAHKALDAALGILREKADLAKTSDSETLGLAGAIFKRKWQTDGDKQHLESSLAYYSRGYQQGTVEERGYTGINAAFVLDLLAQVEDEQAIETTGERSPTAVERRKESRRIREEIVELYGPIGEGEDAGEHDWWWYATLAEAHFGLGIYDRREGEGEFLEEFEAAMDGEREVDEESHYAKAYAAVLTGIMVNAMTPDSTGGAIRWEMESTARQLASLAQLQVGDALEADAWQVIRGLVGEATDALVGSVFRGKLGIGLSGGGFRASLFHIGVFARLAELDLLRHVEVLSGVSGGSIFAAYYYLKVRRLLEEKDDSEVTRDDYVRLVREMADEFLAGVQRNMRTRVVSNLFGNFRMAFARGYSRSDRLAELYEREIYARAAPGESLTMDRLGIRPKDGERENWQRRNKVPNLVLNATTLNTGHNWQFTTSAMGESAFAVDEEIDGNWLLRRMDYRDAPPRHQRISLGRAVGASACVPGLFEPIVFEDLYPKDTERHPEIVVRLVDGGVHDNQGSVSLLEQDCSVIIISDASGQMTSDAHPGGGFLAPTMRMNGILMERVRQAQFQDLKARQRAGLLKGLMIVHMKKAFDVEPVDWKGCEEPPEEDEGRAEELLPFGVRKELQAMIAEVRTDLDSFSDIEAHALMTSGYLMARKYAAELGGYLERAGVAAEGEPADWKFLEVARALGHRGEAAGEEEAVREHGWVRRNLAAASKGSFRAFSLSKPLRFGVLALVVLALAPAAVRWGAANWPLLVAALVLLLLLLKGRGVLKRILGAVLGIFGFVVARIHLWIFDPLFLRFGRLRGAPGAGKK